MAYKIIFKGKMEDLYVSNMKGIQLLLDKNAGKLKGWIEIEGIGLDAESIKAVIPNVADPDSNASRERGNKNIRDNGLSFQKHKEYVLSLSSKDRAQNTGLAGILWLAIKRRKLEGAEKDAVIKAQEIFFEQNPNWGEANPTCYMKDVDIKNRASSMRQRENTMVHIADILPVSMLQLAERQVLNYIR